MRSIVKICIECRYLRIAVIKIKAHSERNMSFRMCFFSVFIFVSEQKIPHNKHYVVFRNFVFNILPLFSLNTRFKVPYFTILSIYDIKFLSNIQFLLNFCIKQHLAKTFNFQGISGIAPHNVYYVVFLFTCKNR